MGKKINYIICALSVLAIFGYMVYVEGVQNLVNNFKDFNYLFLIISLGCMVVYYILEAVSLHLCTSKVSKNQSFLGAFKVSIIGQMFNQLTPFASGGQPVQAYYMTKNKIKVGDAGAILLIKFILYQFALTIFTFITLVFKFNYFRGKIDNFVFLILIGFLINFAVLAFLVYAGFCNKGLKKLTEKIMSFLEKIKLVKQREKIQNNIFAEIDKFNKSFKEIKKEKALVVKCILVTLVQLFFYFIIPYFIIKGINIKSNVNVILVVCASAFVHMISCFVPSPGAVGGAEGSFFVIFAMFFSQHKIVFAIFLWRLCTFYLPIILGMLFMMLGKNKKIDEQLCLS